MLTVKVPISEAHEHALSRCVRGTASRADRDTAWTWICLVRQELFAAWEALPDGNHLKMHLADVAWAWSDEDLYRMGTSEENV